MWAEYIHKQTQKKVKAQRCFTIYGKDNVVPGDYVILTERGPQTVAQGRFEREYEAVAND